MIEHDGRVRHHAEVQGHLEVAQPSCAVSGSAVKRQPRKTPMTTPKEVMKIPKQKRTHTLYRSII